MTDEHVKARPGKPGSHNGRRLRWRAVVREMRATNRGAVAAIAEKEIALKERIARAEVRSQYLRAALVGAAAAGVILWRCAL